MLCNWHHPVNRGFEQGPQVAQSEWLAERLRCGNIDYRFGPLHQAGDRLQSAVTGRPQEPQSASIAPENPDEFTCPEEPFLVLTQTLQDNRESFEVSVRKAATGSPVVLFSVGSGGQPERLCTLLNALAESGCTVVAPHFERLASTTPTEEELTVRARRLTLALDAFIEPSARAIGVGHSIGAAILVAMAGAQLWLGPGHRVSIARDRRLARLALLAPPTGFFQAPDALDAVRVSVLAWVGSEDSITPPAQNMPCTIGTLWMSASPKGLAISRSWTFHRRTPRNRIPTSRRFCEIIQTRSASSWGPHRN